jgi:preprotein translocase SecE subunit
MGNRKYVHLTFMIATVIFAWVFIQATGVIWSYFARPNRLMVNLVGIGLGFILVGSQWINKEKFHRISTIINELKRVTWPTKKETKTATYVVIVTVFIASIIMFSFDWFWSWVTSKILTS